MSMTTALLIIDHGSKVDTANKLLDEVAALIRKQRPELIVEAAHMELAAPSIKDGILACVNQGASAIIAHPYMLSPGRHASKDIPRMVTEAMTAYPHIPFTLTDPLGLSEKLVDLVLERAQL